jgi:hypothetical protein
MTGSSGVDTSPSVCFANVEAAKAQKAKKERNSPLVIFGEDEHAALLLPR